MITNQYEIIKDSLVTNNNDKSITTSQPLQSFKKPPANGKATNGRKIPNQGSETSKETVGSGKQEIETDMKDPLIDTSSKESESDKKKT